MNSEKISTASCDGEMPLVTVIIASYNHGQYIEASIASVLAQTYPHVELLVVDDGSSDNSVQRIQLLQRRYGFDFRVQQNQGLSRTLNEAIARAKGSFIVPFGSDDIMLPQRLQRQVEYLAGKPEVGLCAANVEIIDSEGRLYPEREQKQRDLPFRRLDFDDLFLDRKPGPMVATQMFRREALIDVGCFDTSIRLEDVYITLSILRAGYFIDILPDVLARYRKHANNTYKNLPFMYENLVRTYDRFSDHPRYQEVRGRFMNSMFLKAAKSNKTLAWQILRQLPPSLWGRKTCRGLLRLLIP